MKKKLSMILVLGLIMLLVALTIFPQLLGRNGIPFAHAKFTRPNGVTPTPSPTAVPSLTYYGGPVMAETMNVYPIYWFPNDNGPTTRTSPPSTSSTVMYTV